MLEISVVWPLLSQAEISVLRYWKEYNSTMKNEISRLLHHCYVCILWGRWAFRLDVDKEYHHRDVFSRQVDLVYNSIPLLGLSLWSLIEFIWSFIKFTQRSLWWCIGQQYINRKKFLPFSSISQCFLPSSLTFSRMTLRCLKSSNKKCRRGTKRRNGFRLNWKR